MNNKEFGPSLFLFVCGFVPFLQLLVPMLPRAVALLGSGGGSRSVRDPTNTFTEQQKNTKNKKCEGVTDMTTHSGMFRTVFIMFSFVLLMSLTLPCSPCV